MNFYKPKALCIAIINNTNGKTTYALLEKELLLYVRVHTDSLWSILGRLDVINLTANKDVCKPINVNITKNDILNFLGNKADSVDIDWDELMDSNTGLTKDIPVLENLYLDAVDVKKLGLHVTLGREIGDTSYIKPYIPSTIYGIKVKSIKYLLSSTHIGSGEVVLDLSDVSIDNLSDDGLVKSLVNISERVSTIKFNNWNLRLTVKDFCDMLGNQVKEIDLCDIIIEVDDKELTRVLCDYFVTNIYTNTQDIWINHLKQLDNYVGNNNEESLLNYFNTNCKKGYIKPLGNISNIVEFMGQGYEFEIGRHLRMICLLITEMETVFRNQLNQRGLVYNNNLIGPLQMLEEIPRYGDNTDFIHAALLLTNKHLITKSKLDRMKLKSGILLGTDNRLKNFIVIKDN